MAVLTERYVRALDYARIAHADQVRKGSSIPYIYHLLGVSSLVLGFGGTEDQAIAGLLHDVLEDCGAHHEPAIRTRFGDQVAGMVLDCTDGTAEGKAMHEHPQAKRHDWLRRKLAYLGHVLNESDTALLVSACDKLHNAGTIVGDLEDPAVGIAVFDRFTAKREQTLGFYQSLSEIFSARQSPVARAFDAVVARMHFLAGVERRASLQELEAASSEESAAPRTPTPGAGSRTEVPFWGTPQADAESRALVEKGARTLIARVQADWHPEDHRDDPESDPAKDV